MSRQCSRYLVQLRAGHSAGMWTAGLQQAYRRQAYCREAYCWQAYSQQTHCLVYACKGHTCGMKPPWHVWWLHSVPASIPHASLLAAPPPHAHTNTPSTCNWAPSTAAAAPRPALPAAAALCCYPRTNMPSSSICCLPPPPLPPTPHTHHPPVTGLREQQLQHRATHRCLLCCRHAHPLAAAQRLAPVAAHGVFGQHHSHQACGLWGLDGAEGWEALGQGQHGLWVHRRSKPGHVGPGRGGGEKRMVVHGCGAEHAGRCSCSMCTPLHLWHT
jgi:hypothetical protein